MVSEYDIAGGDATLEIDVVQGTNIIGCFVVSDSALNSSITLTMGQSVDNGTTINVFPEKFEDGTNTADAGQNSNILQTKSYVKGGVYLIIKVNSATLGTLTFDSFGK